MQKQSSRNDFNQSRQHIKTQKNYNHWQVLEKIEKYNRFIKSKNDRDALAKLKDQYEKGENKKPIIRAQRDQNFLLAQRTGITTDKTLFDVRNGDKIQDAHNRKEVVKKAKALYHKNYSLSGKFSKRVKSIAMDKEK